MKEGTRRKALGLRHQYVGRLWNSVLTRWKTRKLTTSPEGL